MPLGCRAVEHWSIRSRRKVRSSLSRVHTILEVPNDDFVGDDWAEAHHDVHLMNEAGDRLAAKRLPEGLTGIAAYHAVVAATAPSPGDVVIGIETDRGLWVQTLIASGYQVYAINR